MRILVALCLMLALCDSALARESYNAQVDQHIARLAMDREISIAASTMGVKRLRVYFSIGSDGKVHNVRIVSPNASVNLRKLVERKVHSLPRMQPPPGGKSRKYLFDLVI